MPFGFCGRPGPDKNHGGACALSGANSSFAIRLGLSHVDREAVEGTDRFLRRLIVPNADRVGDTGLKVDTTEPLVKRNNHVKHYALAWRVAANEQLAIDLQFDIWTRMGDFEVVLA